MAFKNDTVLVDQAGSVATVTLNRPDRRNAMDAGMADEFRTALWGLDEDPAVRAIVVTGAGRDYCSGIDISGGPVVFHQDPDNTVEADADMVVRNFALWRMRTPVIGAINGAAIGAGLTTALLFDVLFVADDARLSFRFSRLGVLPEANSLWLLPRLIGVQRALDLLLSGRDFSGAEAAAIGLAKVALPKEGVVGAAVEYAQQLAATTSPISLALIKRLVYGMLQETDRAGAMAEETDWTWWTGTQPDIVEAITAMNERRAPTWKTTKLDVPAKLPR
jgi:enoyl-CoA hydratase/carnithine racemase